MNDINHIESKIYVDQLLASLKNMGPNHKRNLEIFKAYVLDGLTLAQVSKEFGFAYPETSRQIVAKIGRRLAKKMKKSA